MFALFHRYVAIPAFERLWKGRRTGYYLRHLERTQWLTKLELQQLQFGALRNLVSHAFSHCPYYRRWWSQHGLALSQLGSLEDFQRWPLTDRSVVRQHRYEMQATNYADRLLSKSTGGSSGDPLQFDLDPMSEQRRTAAWHRGYAWAGAELGTKQLYLWGAPLTPQSQAQRLKRFIYDRCLYRRQMLNSFEFREETLTRFVHRLNRHRPGAIVAYTNPLYELARGIERLGLRVHQPRSIVVGAEKLHDFQRSLIERTFGAPVFETYGAREFMLIAAQCEQQGALHMTMEHLLVELLDDDGKPTREGQEGNVVITDLYNYGMPLIRYANGDRAIASSEPCGCGRGLTLLEKVVGRKLDVLYTPDGRKIPGEFFPHLLKDFAKVNRFQVIQDQPDQLELRLAVSQDWSELEQQELKHRVEQVVGPKTHLSIQRVDKIELSRSGKLRVVCRNF